MLRLYIVWAIRKPRAGNIFFIIEKGTLKSFLSLRILGFKPGQVGGISGGAVECVGIRKNTPLLRASTPLGLTWLGRKKFEVG